MTFARIVVACIKSSAMMSTSNSSGACCSHAAGVPCRPKLTAQLISTAATATAVAITIVCLSMAIDMMTAQKRPSPKRGGG